MSMPFLSSSLHRTPVMLFYFSRVSLYVLASCFADLSNFPETSTVIALNVIKLVNLTGHQVPQVAYSHKNTPSRSQNPGYFI